MSPDCRWLRNQYEKRGVRAWWIFLFRLNVLFRFSQIVLPLFHGKHSFIETEYDEDAPLRARAGNGKISGYPQIYYVTRNGIFLEYLILNEISHS